MRKFLIAVLAASLMVPSVVVAQSVAQSGAQSVTQSGALSAGKPAGVRGAQMDRTGLFVGMGAAALAIGVAVMASDCCQHSNAPVVIPTVTTQP